MEPKPTVSDLLALRDGEVDDPGLAARVADDAEAGQALEELRRLKTELNALPPVSPDPSVWQAIQERTGQQPGWLQRFPLATAATVFLAAALTIVLWDPTAGPVQGPNGPQASDPVAQLILRSQRLESELLTQAAAPVPGGSPTEQALVYGIADVDAQLNELYAADSTDPEARERLWRQRVMLLESLADVQRGEAVLRPAVY
ncbi:MAG: hypothetical protein U5Q16_04385 [Gammaproteobacteria bacterium]|nr:hypothetical protein [Gammaproteobacteria bacterium]